MRRGGGTDWQLETDVVCVGSGLAGCAGALAAADHDLEVMVVEKDARFGGGTAASDGRLWVPENDLERVAGIADSIEEGQTYLRFLAAGGTVDRNLIAYVDKAPAALRYFLQLGIRFQLVRNVADIDFGVAPGAKAEGRMVEIAPFSGHRLGDLRDKLRVSPRRQQRDGDDTLTQGEGLIATFVKALRDRSERITLNAPARRLVVEDGRVIGSLVEIDGRDVAVRTRFGVLLTAGESALGSLTTGLELQADDASSPGLLTNARGQVLDRRGDAVPGLYATGDCAAANDFGIDGLSRGRGLIFSLAAVRHMLAGTGQERLV